MRILPLVLLVTLTGCGPIVATSNLPPSASCTTDSQCASGLTCRPLGQFSSDGGCSEVGKVCSKSCGVDGDCAGLPTTGFSSFRCFGACDGSKSCAGVN
jgi:hypothetical protein